MQLKGARFLLQGPWFPLRAIGPPYRPSVPLTEALFNCLIVGHSPGFNCTGPRGASKNVGLGRTKHIYIYIYVYIYMHAVELKTGPIFALLVSIGPFF